MSSIPTDARFTPFLEKMRGEKLSESAIAAFGHSFMEYVTGSAGCIPEKSIKPADSLPNFIGDIKGKVTQKPELLSQTVVLKLNGGLGKWYRI
jgi:UTP--glucose-1-phosphate uridylyltransferase